MRATDNCVLVGAHGFLAAEVFVRSTHDFNIVLKDTAALCEDFFRLIERVDNSRELLAKAEVLDIVRNIDFVRAIQRQVVHVHAALRVALTRGEVEIPGDLVDLLAYVRMCVEMKI